MGLFQTSSPFDADVGECQTFSLAFIHLEPSLLITDPTAAEISVQHRNELAHRPLPALRDLARCFRYWRHRNSAFHGRIKRLLTFDLELRQQILRITSALLFPPPR